MAVRTPRVGDVFTVHGRRLVGRVVSTSAVVGPTHGCILVYVYADARLSRDALLLPPLLTTRAPWSRGVFEWLRTEPLLPGQTFDHHAFRSARGDWLDEQGRPVSAPEGPVTGPVAEYRLFEVEAIEAALAKAPGGYDPPTAGPGAAGDMTRAMRDLMNRWVATFGRPPTLDEWVSLYDVAIGTEDEERSRS